MCIKIETRPLEALPADETIHDILSSFRAADARLGKSARFPYNTVSIATQRQVTTAYNVFQQLAADLKGRQDNNIQATVYTNWLSLLSTLAAHDLTSTKGEFMQSAYAFGTMQYMSPNLPNYPTNPDTGEMKPVFVAYGISFDELPLDVDTRSPPQPDDSVVESGIPDDGAGDPESRSERRERVQDFSNELHIYTSLSPRWDSVPMPVIIAAGPSELVPMLSSAVLSRWYCSIDFPVVGLRISKSGYMCDLVIAMVRDSESDADPPPPQNSDVIIDIFCPREIAPATFRIAEPHMPFGSLDLSESGTFKALILFLAELKAQFNDIDSYCPFSTHKVRSWKSDAIVRQASDKPTAAPTVGNRVSSSAFAALSGSTERWMLHRRVFTVATCVFDTESAHLYPRNAHEMARMYDDITKFGWGSGWDMKATGFPDIPTANATEDSEKPEGNALYPLWENACRIKKKVERRLASDPKKRWIEGPSEIVILSEEDEEILRKKMPIILMAASCMRALQAREIEVVESETREIWDDLVRHFCIRGYNELTRDSSLHARTLSYPQNSLRRALRQDDHAWITDLADRTWKWHHSNGATWLAFGDSEDRDSRGDLQIYLGLRSVLNYARDESDTLSIELKTLRKGPQDVFAETIQQLEQHEPADGRPDLLLYATVNVQAQASDDLGKLAQAIENIKLVHVTYSDGADPSGGQAKSESNATHTRTGGATHWQKQASKPTTPSLQLLLPQLVVTHKRPDEAKRKVLNQMRMYCASTVAFLQEIGVINHPVFALATYGTRVALMMGWAANRPSEARGETDDSIFIFERRIARYDLADPFEAIQFASVLLKIDKLQIELEKKFNSAECQAYLLGKLRDEKYEGWSISRTVTSVSEDSEAVNKLTGDLGGLFVDNSSSVFGPAAVDEA